ncbi:recombinase family protein [Ruminococcaceae bacterium OttesenSCG-928-I18]|nr:recombinase family protein [Ruminococcaceae bacterium OttesenSCG-928-I18]
MKKIYAYMRISTTKATQKVDRQEATLKEYAAANSFAIDAWYSDAITGATKAINRPEYARMKESMRKGDTLLICDIDRLGRNADDVIMEMKMLRADGIRVVALDVPYLNDWHNVNDDSMYQMIIDIVITLKAHMAQQEKEKIQSRISQGLDAARKKGKKLGRPATGVPAEFAKEYQKYRAGKYGKVSAVQFAKMVGIGRSTYYKYVNLLEGKVAANG